jgi:hypothetical protein
MCAVTKAMQPCDELNQAETGLHCLDLALAVLVGTWEDSISWVCFP